ncbi:hypothetical protein FA95DRAFT_1564136 [Auriscalpium vulgare]|uniref:Uncharacterized protein n=1 Tax=Auriscalpium vulgare TaxID=40419 RepID=A0ACB8RF40_9AGAM|nr:hypothetical protein FA95DRAFT_1564136 [Auriscalpium vulgare]
MNTTHLSKLPRAELQKLAQTHGVKANAKTTAIIDRLCELFPQGVPRVVKPLPSKKRFSSVAPPPLAPRAPKRRARAASPDTTESNAIQRPPSTEHAGPSGATTDPPTAVRPSSSHGLASPPATPPPPPDAQEPVDPDFLKQLLAMVDSIAEENRQDAARVPIIQAKAQQLLEACEHQREKLLIARARRERLQNYILCRQTGEAKGPRDVAAEPEAGEPLEGLQDYDYDDASSELHRIPGMLSPEFPSSDDDFAAALFEDRKRRRVMVEDDDDDDEPSAKRFVTPTRRTPRSAVKLQAVSAGSGSFSSNEELDRSRVLDILNDGEMDNGDEDEQGSGEPAQLAQTKSTGGSRSSRNTNLSIGEAVPSSKPASRRGSRQPSQRLSRTASHAS